MPIKPKHPYTLQIPMSGVSLSSNSILKQAFDGELEYLLTFYKVDDILLHFRERE